MFAKKLIGLAVFIITIFVYGEAVLAIGLLLDPFPTIRAGLGGRGKGMGETGVVTSYGAEAAFFNPAGTAWGGNSIYSSLSTQQSEFVNPAIFGGAVYFRGRLNFLKYPVLKYVRGVFVNKFFEDPYFGLILHNYRIGELQAVGVNTISGAPEPGDNFDQQNTMVGISYSSPLGFTGRNVLFGLNLYYLQINCFDETGKGRFVSGIDLGILARVGKSNLLALGETDFNLGARLRTIYPIKWNIGGSYSQNGWTYADFGISLSHNRSSIDANSGNKLELKLWEAALALRIDENESYSFSGGLEFKPVPKAALRIGCKNFCSNTGYNANKAITYGMGINLPSGFDLDYTGANYIGKFYNLIDTEWQLSLCYHINN